VEQFPLQDLTTPIAIANNASKKSPPPSNELSHIYGTKTILWRKVKEMQLGRNDNGGKE
jgi:hypothetical protein